MFDGPNPFVRYTNPIQDSLDEAIRVSDETVAAFKAELQAPYFELAAALGFGPGANHEDVLARAKVLNGYLERIRDEKLAAATKALEEFMDAGGSALISRLASAKALEACERENDDE